MGSKNKDKHNTKRKTSKNGKEKLNLIEDPRFSKVHYDPVFQNVPKNNSKLKIDSRFSGVFTDKRFATSSARVDKCGKVKQQSENELRRYYSDEDDDEEKKKTTTKKNSKALKKKKNKKEKSELLNDVDEDDEEEQNVGGEISESESESDELLKAESIDTSSSDDTDDDDDDDDLSADDASVEVENVPVIEKETHRLAVVNMDWSQVKAVDLLVMLSSCLPKGGQIKSVAVYPSEFGLKRMEEEAVRGPVALFEDEEKKDEDDSDEDEDDISEDEGESDDNEAIDDEEDANEVSDNEEDEDDVSDKDNLDEDDDLEGMYDDIEGDSDNEFDDDDDGDDEDEDDDDDEIDNEKLRAYEKSRLRYYFAVVECDSIATADCLYKACDGLEFERSSNVLDLRFIPDSMEFKHQPRDVATEAPAEYEGLDFQTRALQQSNAALSWDDDEPHRVKTLRRNFTEKQLAEMELSEFLASDESESESDDEDGDGDEDPSDKRKKKADRYRALLQLGDGLEEDEGQNMEVTFATGLEDISKKILEKKEKGSETVFESYLRKKKEKKDARKDRSKNSSDDDSDESDSEESAGDPDDFFEEAPSAERSKKDKQRKKKQDEKVALEKQTELSKAELELLLADEDGANKKPKGYKINKKKAKGKKGHETADETNLPTVDVEDPRFSALFNNPGYALDPTDPQFKRSATYHRQLAKKQQQSSKEHEDVEPMESSIQKEDELSADTWQKGKHELSAMIKSVKMKSQQLPLLSTGQRKNKTQLNGTSGKKHKLPRSDRPTKKAKHQK